MQLVFLLLSVVLLLSSGAASPFPPILDESGDPVQAGQLYYAMSSTRGVDSGGLRLVHLSGEKACPLYAAKGSADEPLGEPLALFPENPNKDTIREGNTLYIIMFARPTNCSESTVWRYDGQNNYVTTGGTSSSSTGPHYSRFVIGKDESLNAYQISPCPCGISSVWPYCTIDCYPSLGVDFENGNRPLRVGSNSNVHSVVFRKVKEGGNEVPIRSATTLNKY